ncbi:MAG: hypothetical protein H0V82_09840 [Candidatus Protochlamydia sp.]|nr:hypothetical protein [Candidatus Protochlamydia sp.]
MNNFIVNVNKTILLVSLDRYCDYLPLVSTATNMTHLFQKCVILPFMEASTISNSRFYSHLDQKNFTRCLILIVPFIGNLIIILYDFSHWYQKVENRIEEDVLIVNINKGEATQIIEGEEGTDAEARTKKEVEGEAVEEVAIQKELAEAAAEEDYAKIEMEEAAKKAQLMKEQEHAAAEEALIQQISDRIMKEAEEYHAAENTRIQKERAERDSDKRRLPNISNKDMEATSGSSNQHSQWFHDNIGHFHIYGDKWADEKLQFLFCEGIFQHYFFQFTGFDFKKVKLVADDKYQISFNFNVVNQLRRNRRIEIYLWYNLLGDALKENILLKKLGGAFQLTKVQMEKMHNDMNQLETMEEKEKLQTQMIALDRKATDCQILIFYWIKAICEDAIHLVIKSKKNDYKNINASIIPDLVNKEYEFLSFEVYQELIETYGKEKYPR